jgi:8-amino-7-oxononanoate synthase
MGLLDKFKPVQAMSKALSSAGGDPTKVVLEKLLSATEAIIGGRQTILAGTNNYLGLTFDSSCIAAGQRALAAAGTGTTGSRMANGTFSEHLALEGELAEFYGYPFGMVFSTGYAANLGTLSALAGPEDVVFLDSDAHASLYDGCRMSGAAVYRFKHNDVSSLEKRLRRLSDKAANALIVVEGQYSVLGDRAPLAEFARVKREYGAYLFVDEAHSLGVFGKTGRGVVEEAGVLDEVDFVVGTFSKSLGSIGGFCVSPHRELTLFRYASRPYVFTASPSPATVATTRQALHQLRTQPWLREQLWRNARHLHGGLEALGLQLGPEVSPIIAVRFEQSDLAKAHWTALLELGVYTNLMLPPATPAGSSLVRCSVTAAHTSQQIDSIIEAFKSVRDASLPLASQR